MCSNTCSPASRCVVAVRLIIDAECSRCGLILSGGLEVVERATTHTVSTGHIVILNGTVDAPEQEEWVEGSSALPSPK